MTCSNELNTTTPPAGVASDHPLGSHAAQILATEHWSLLATRTLIWNEAMSRATVFLTVLSASIIALALLADATGFGRQTTTLALVLLPVVLLLGVATYVRQVQINNEEFKLVLAMNRLRHAYLTIEPGLEPYLTTGHHDDERGLVATYMLDHPTRACPGLDPRTALVSPPPPAGSAGPGRQSTGTPTPRPPPRRSPRPPGPMPPAASAPPGPRPPHPRWR